MMMSGDGDDDAQTFKAPRDINASNLHKLEEGGH
jgi:hypothetical protein